MANNLWYLTRYPYTQLIDEETDAACRRRFAEGERIEFSAAETGLILIDGHIRIVRGGTDHGEVTLDVLNPRDILGSLAEPSDEEPLHAVAMDVCTAYELPRDLLEKRSGSAPLPPIEVVHRSVGSQRSLRVDVRDLLFQSGEARVARALLLLADARPPSDSRPLSRCVPLPVWRLAELAGLGREALKITLRDWERSGWVETGWGGIRALRTDALRQKADVCAPARQRHESPSPVSRSEPVAAQAVKSPAAEPCGPPAT